MMGEQSKDEFILREKQIDLIYSQFDMIYQILPNAPRAKTDPTKVTPGMHADRVIGSRVNQLKTYMGKVSLQ